MAVSDAIYVRCKRYVSRERLQSMLDYEHRLNLEWLRTSRGDSTAFLSLQTRLSVSSLQDLFKEEYYSKLEDGSHSI